MFRLPMFFVFSRKDFLQRKLPISWRSLGFSHRMYRSVVVDLFFFSTETVPHGCQKRPVPCPATCWPQALSWSCPLLPGCSCMLGIDDHSNTGAFSVALSLRMELWTGKPKLLLLMFQLLSICLLC